MNPASRKPRADSKLKTLPEAQQALVFSWCSGTLESAVSRCASDLRPPVVTNLDAMSQFRRWYAARMQNAEAWEKCLATAEADAQHSGGKSGDWVQEQARNYFARRAVTMDDAETFAKMDSLRQGERALTIKAKGDKIKAEQKDRDLALVERRVALLESREAKTKETLADATLSLEQRQARIKEIFGVQ